MSVRVVIAALCVAAFAAGPAVTQARADVQASVTRDNFAVVGTSVDSVAAATPLAGSLEWDLGLYNNEPTSVTDARIHLDPPSGSPPPDATAATLAPNGYIYNDPPGAAVTFQPGFDSSRAVSPGTADPGTHTQTVTIIVTPQQAPLGFGGTPYVSVDIVGYDAAANGAVVSAPASSSVDGAGTSEVRVGFYPLLPTQYTIQVTFDVTNNTASPAPFKPRVLISQSFSRGLGQSSVQPSTSYTDPELGTATWSVDQGVVWSGFVGRLTDVSYTPIAVPYVPTSPTAEGYDSRGTYVELPPETDSVSGATTYSGFRTWYAGIFNLGSATIPAPQISVDRSSQTFTPPVTFPLTTGVGADLTAQYQSLNLQTLSGRGSGNSQVDGVPVSTGFDLTRTLSPSTLPAGGGTQDVTVTFVPRAPDYAGKFVSITVEAVQASIVSGSVTTDSGGQSEPAPTVSGNSLSWYPNGLVVGRAYTVTLKIAVTGGGTSAFPYKPLVTGFVSTMSTTTKVVGRSETIADDVLGGTFTFTAGTDVDWWLFTNDGTQATLDAITPPKPSYVYTYINNFDNVNEPADVDSIAAGSATTGRLTWYAAMCDTTGVPLPTPSISVDQSSLTFTPPVSFPVATAPQTTLAGNGCLDLQRLSGGSPNSAVEGYPSTTAYDVSRTMSPATIPPGGGTQTVHLSVTPRDPREEQITLEVMTGLQGAQIDASSVVWPTLGDGEQTIGTQIQPWYVDESINNVVVGKTYTLTVQIQVPNTSASPRTYKPAIYTTAGFHVDVDAGTPPEDGPSTTVHDDLLGGTLTFSFGTAVHWTHNLWRVQTVDLAGLWSGEPVGYVGAYRITRVAPDASIDSVDGASAMLGSVLYSAYIWNYGYDTITAPRISLDGSSQTFVPPVTFPLSTTGADLQQYDTLWLSQLDGEVGHSHVDVAGFKTGADVSRTMTPQTIPAGGGTQTVSVSLTLRDPQTDGDGVSIDVNPGEIVPGAAVVAGSVVPPVVSGNGQPYTYVSSDGREVYWSLTSASVDTTYTLTFQVHVPNGTSAPPLRYKPPATVEVDSPTTQLPEEVGTATTIPDAVLGGTFTFSAGTDVDWGFRSQFTYTEVVLAPLAAPADTTPPVLTLPADRTVEATGPSGAVVSYAVTAKDDVDPSPTVACTPASGSPFPLGATTVKCTATDASGNAASGTFTVTVVDTTPPLLTLPAGKVVDATGPSGAPVTFTVAATDLVDPKPVVACSPKSGSVFAIGTTTVKCTATDASGNAKSGSFTVKVKGAAEQLADLAVEVKGVGPGRSLADTVALAQWFVARHRPGEACLTLTAFTLEVRAQSGRKIPAAQASALVADANRIKTVLGCGR